MNIGIFILAAGSSSRLGKPKQLLIYQGENLLDRAYKIASSVHKKNVHVVLGFEANKIKKMMSFPSERVIINENWQAGMSSSIVEAVKIAIAKSYDGAIFLTCDQIHLTSQIICNLISSVNSAQGIVISKYAKGKGIPSFFPSSYFDELASLQAGHGAQELVKKYKKHVAMISFPKGHIDIDTIDDLKHLDSS